jgi:SAM-dependent methyltransferase
VTTVPLCAGRSEQQHRRACDLLNGLLQLPASRLRNVLDVGCGLGSWSRDVACHYPYMQVTGIDTDEQVIEMARKMANEQNISNVSFYHMDVTQPMHFAEQAFDLIFARYLFLHLSRQSWTSTVNALATHLRPGGYLQLVDGGLEKASTSAWEQLLQIFAQVVHKRGQDPQAGMAFPSLLINAGLYLYQCTYHPLLTGAWSTSNISARDALARFVKVRQFIAQSSQLSLEHYDALLEHAKQELDTPGFLASGSVISAIGQKPEQ